MAKNNEINYIAKVAEVDGVPLGDFKDYLARKPFSDASCGEYLLDMAQVLRLLPPPPARLLDVGVGSGWTSELVARRGYEVVGVDISPDMIELANERATTHLSFQCLDYESDELPGGFDIAVIYDSLHHAEDTRAVLRNIQGALKNGGMLLTIEPGAGHSKTEDSLNAMRKYGTTEKDMPASLQRSFLHSAGFGTIRQYLRLSQLPLVDISNQLGSLEQARFGLSLGYESLNGMTSILAAFKDGAEPSTPNSSSSSKALLGVAAEIDRHLQRKGVGDER